MRNELNDIISAIDKTISTIREPGDVPGWYHHTGDVPDALQDTFSKAGWDVVRPQYSWSSATGCHWFRQDIALSEKVRGISLIGSRVDLMICLPISATVFLNGKQIYFEPFWADTRAFPLTLTDDYQPDEVLRIAIRTVGGDGFGAFVNGSLIIHALDKVAFELETFRAQLVFCGHLLKKDADRLEAFGNALADVDIHALARDDWETWNRSVTSSVKCLAPFYDEAKRYEVNLVAHSHIDMNWLWPWRETVDVCRRDFSTMDMLMEKYQEFQYSQSQVAAYKTMEDEHPQLFERIRQRVREGRWEVTASTWVEGDLDMASGESLVRQLLYSRRYTQEKFGLTPKICWEPDTFGHPATYPQILKKSGVEYYYLCRGEKEHSAFWWQGLDGSRVLAYAMRGYSGFVNPTTIVDSCKQMDEQLGYPGGFVVYGVGDHGGAAAARDIERACLLDKTPALPRSVLSTAADFYEKLAHKGDNIPTVTGEMSAHFAGCYTSHADIKLLNRHGENSLLTAETMSAVAAANGAGKYPQDALNEAWINQCFHQFHDIICGCSLGATYREAADKLRPSHDTLHRIISDSIASLAANVDTAGHIDTSKIVVFNQLAWERTDLVEVALPDATLPSVGYLEDDSGLTVPFQVVDDKLMFVARNVPALGCKVYTVQTADARAISEADCIGIDTENLVFENNLFRIRINPRSGSIDSLYIKELKKELAEPEGYGIESKVNSGVLNRFVISYEQPHQMSAWNIGDITGTRSLIDGANVNVIETGRVCAVIAVRHVFSKSTIKQLIRVYSHLDRIDFLTEVEWHERGTADEDASMLKVTFTPALGHSRAFFEIPFGAIERIANGKEVPAQKWADISDAECGISILNNCKYGHSAQGNTLALTLLRASYEPDANPDEGSHEFAYSLYPHKGSWKDAGSTKRGMEFNQPLLASWEPTHSGSITPGKACLSCEPENVLVSAVKFAEDQPEDAAAIIVRVVETHGIPTTATIRCGWPVKQAVDVDLMENGESEIETSNGSVSLDFGKYEIKTLKLLLER